MTPNWYKSESRDVRPFFGVESLDEALNGAELQLSENAPFRNENSFSIGDDEIRKLRPVIRHNLSVELVTSCSEIKPKDLTLVIAGTNPFLKNSIVIETHRLDSEFPAEIVVPAEALDLLGGGGNMFLDVTLCLDSDLPKRPGRPFLRGHWLSRKTFRIKPISLSQEFNVKPLDDEGWKVRGLPPKTLYYVDYIGFINEQANADQPIADVYVHADVYNRLVSETNMKAIRPLMTFLAAEISCQILASSAKDWESVLTATPQSPLAAFMKRLARMQKLDLAQLRLMVNEPGMQKIRALLQADQETVRAVVEI